MIIKVVEDDVLNCQESFVMQITNCVAITPHGLNAIFTRRWPWANVYRSRRRSSDRKIEAATPGTVAKMRPAKDEDGPIVLCLMAQWAPGRPDRVLEWYPPKDDSIANRYEWFRQCIRTLENDKEITDRIAVPFRLGCGMGGGDWKDYEGVLQRSTLRFVIYRLKSANSTGFA
jgi:hypothetical protein